MPNFEKLPLFPLHAVLFPHVSLPLHIFEERYRLMIARCIERGEPFGIVLLQQGSEVDQGDGTQPDVFNIGTLARIERAEQLDDGRFYISARGESRFLIEELFSDEPYLTARVRAVWEQNDDPLDLQPLFDQASEQFRAYIGALLNDTQRHLGSFQLPHDPSLLSYAIGASLQVTLSEKQILLEARSAAERLQQEIEMLQREREVQEFFTSECDDRDESRDSEIDSGGQTTDRTILRVDPSYSQYYFSKN